LPSSELFEDSGTKPLLRRHARNRLPVEVLRHHKWGFGVPWGKYLRSVPELRDQIKKLPGMSFFDGSPFQLGRLQSLISEFLIGADHHEPLVKQLLMLAIWHQVSFGKQYRAVREVTASIQQSEFNSSSKVRECLGH
jgi:hypothetical protein